MRRRKVYGSILLVVLLVCILVFSACGSKKPGNESENPSKGSSDKQLVWVISEVLSNGLELSKIADAINEQLKKDGYDFSVRFEPLEEEDPEGKDYKQQALAADADIVFVGLDDFTDEEIRCKEIYEQGYFVSLDKYLSGSDLEKTIPSVCWESVRLNGSVYCIPNCAVTRRGIDVVFDLNKVDPDVAESFDGDIYKLAKLLPEGEKIFYFAGVNEFMLCYGYQYDSFGLIGDSEGKMVNPFQEESYTEWTTCFDELYRDGKLTGFPEDEWAIGVFFCDPMYSAMDGYYVKSISDIPVPSESFSCTTGIRADSDYKDEAFQLLELVYTNPVYGNLLLYGTSDVDAIESNDKYLQRMMFGINDFVVPMNPPMFGYFATPEERLEHYKNSKVQVTFAGYNKDKFNKFYLLKQNLSAMIYPSADEFKKEYKSYEEYQTLVLEYRHRLSEMMDDLLITITE